MYVCMYVCVNMWGEHCADRAWLVSEDWVGDDSIVLVSSDMCVSMCMDVCVCMHVCVCKYTGRILRGWCMACEPLVQ